MCGLVDEYVIHLFFTCNVALGVWNLCTKWVGVSNVYQFIPKQQFSQFYCVK